MALNAMVTAMTEYWADLMIRLAPADRNRLRELARKLRDGPSREDDPAFALVDLLTDRLPRNHPVRRALLLDEPTMGDTEAGPRAAAGDLDRLVRQLDRQQSPGDPRRATEAAVRSRVLGFAMRTETRSATRDLIRLPAGDAVLLPAFQLSERAEPLPVVLRVNGILGAAEDPWGVADWWFSPHALLPEPPYRMVGRVPDDVLVDIARREVAED